MGQLSAIKPVCVPSLDLIFNAFISTPVEDVRVIIIGDEPYYKRWQSNGLAFGYRDRGGLDPLPYPLQIISQELLLEYKHHFLILFGLENWADDGVLLLNHALTSKEDTPGAFVGIWQGFIDRVVQFLQKTSNNNVYMIWGKYAEKSLPVIDAKKNLVLRSANPVQEYFTPGAFLGNNHFVQANKYLKKHKKEEIRW